MELRVLSDRPVHMSFYHVACVGEEKGFGMVYTFDYSTQRRLRSENGCKVDKFGRPMFILTLTFDDTSTLKDVFKTRIQDLTLETRNR